MDLKQIKKITNFARRAGVKSISIADLRIEFKDEILIQHRKPKLVGTKEERTIPAPPPLPTIDDINDYIYGQTEEVG